MGIRPKVTRSTPTLAELIERGWHITLATGDVIWSWRIEVIATDNGAILSVTRDEVSVLRPPCVMRRFTALPDAVAEAEEMLQRIKAGERP